MLANRDARFFDDVLLRSLSAKCEVIACVVEEHLMCSGAKRWRDGKQTWPVIHDAGLGLEHLDTLGRLPTRFRPIRDELTARRGREPAVDWRFDTPVELARAETGFRHDLDGPTIERLTSRQAKPKRTRR